MKNFQLTVLFSLLWTLSFGQSQLPFSFNRDVLSQEVPIQTMPAVDVQSLMAEDEIDNALKVGPYRFGHNMEVNVNAQSDGLWEELKDGSRVWRMGFRCADAFSVNFIFSDFYLPFGAKFHIYNEGGETIYGPFTYSDNREDNGFATFPVPGELVFLELYEPVMAIGQSRIVVETVTHGYRDIFRLSESRGGGSGACNNNINCPEGANWQDHKRSVAIMVSGGSGFCTGAMVNNTAQDGTPYFLSANHCMGGGTNNWVFKFDYERTGCANTGGPNLSGGNFTQGATIRASNAGSDFALLQLNSTPPAGHNVYYSGWDRSGVTPSNQIGIHHPSGDYKKISFDNNPATQVADWGGAACWHIGNWEDGTTEPGSSGSPLFDQNQRIIGQLYGGSANCSNNVDDYYGRFNVSWDGSSSSTRLRDWLDPTNSGVATLDGYDPNASTVALDAAVQNIGGVASGATLCTSVVTPTVTLLNRGTSALTSATITWTVNGTAQTPVNWTGSLAYNQSAVVNLPQLTLPAGSNTIAFTVTSPNGGADQNAANNLVAVTFNVVNGAEMSVVIMTDNYPEETSWEIRNQSNVVVASGSGYDNSVATLLTIPTCLPDGCYTFTIIDEYGDGICCQYGQGHYELLSPEGTSMGNGAEFTAQESLQFCLPFSPSAVNEGLLAGTISTYPNPTLGLLSIDLPIDRTFSDIVVTDITGRTVRKIPVTRSGRMTIDLGGLSDGVYHLTFFTAESRVTKKVVVMRP
ncbi:MAG: trypsin-like peptidase domain-containing protein [Flavobacteriales bacterium]|nr:trypsin-like peptidase domain-containing protein [Flavobacteriales bacterium]